MIFLQKDAPERVGYTRFADLDCWRRAKVPPHDEVRNRRFADLDCWRRAEADERFQIQILGLLTSIVGGVQKMNEFEYLVTRVC